MHLWARRQRHGRCPESSPLWQMHAAAHPRRLVLGSRPPEVPLMDDHIFDRHTPRPVTEEGKCGRPDGRTGVLQPRSCHKPSQARRRQEVFRCGRESRGREPERRQVEAAVAPSSARPLGPQEAARPNCRAEQRGKLLVSGRVARLFAGRLTIPLARCRVPLRATPKWHS